MTIEEASEIVRTAGLTGSEGKFCIAAGVLMAACDKGQQVAVEDLLRCLEFPGFVAECGASGLFALTRRQRRLGFITDKKNWAAYLEENGFLKSDIQPDA